MFDHTHQDFAVLLQGTFAYVMYGSYCLAAAFMCNHPVVDHMTSSGIRLLFETCFVGHLWYD